MMSRFTPHRSPMAGPMVALTAWSLSVVSIPAPVASASEADPTTPDGPSADDRANMLAFFEEGWHPQLRWPDYSDYRQHVTDFYRERDFRLAWIENGKVTSQAFAIATILADADAKGVNATDYDGDRWTPQLQAIDQGDVTTPRLIGLIDVGLTVSIMRYISDLHIGRINPRKLDFELSVETKKYDLPDFVEGLAIADDVGTVLAEIEPPYLIYQILQAGLNTYRELAAENEWSVLPADRTIKPGDRYADSKDLARMLVIVGDLPPEEEQAAATGPYGPKLTAAVKRFQARHGLDVDGIIGKGTFAELNTTLSERVDQIQLSLERMRWLPGNLADGTYIVVNIAGFDMFAMRGGRDHMLDMNVIVGKQFPDRQTPVFTGRMAYIEFSPYWNVPNSIARRDLIPAIVKDPTELDKRHLEMVRDFSPKAVPQEPTAQNIQRLQRGAFLLRQKPGPHNALGPAKFIFPNSHSVYLHGTPAQGLFARSKRTFSSGCVRVEDPLALAEFLLRGDESWDEDRIEKAMHADSPTRVHLDDPTWVFILYATAWVDDDGTVNFRDDIYGHDARLAEALAQGYPYPW